MTDERSTGIPLASETMVRVRLIAADPLRARAAVYAALAGLPSVKRVASSASDAATFWLTTRSMAALLSEVTQASALAEAQVSWEPTEGLILRLPVELERGGDRALTWRGDGSDEGPPAGPTGGVQEAVLNWNREDGWILRTASPAERPEAATTDDDRPAASPDVGPAAAPAGVGEVAAEPDGQPEPDAGRAISQRPIPPALAETATAPPDSTATEPRTESHSDEPTSSSDGWPEARNEDIEPAPEPDQRTEVMPPPEVTPDAEFEQPRTPVEEVENPDRPTQAPSPAEAAAAGPTDADTDAAPVEPPESPLAVSMATTAAGPLLPESVPAAPPPAAEPVRPPAEDATPPPVSGRKASLDRARADESHLSAPVVATDAATEAAAVPASDAPMRRRRAQLHAAAARPRRRRWPYAVAALLIPAAVLVGVVLLSDGRGEGERASEAGGAAPAGGAPGTAGVLTVFGDALAGGWRDASRGATVSSVASPVYAGDRSLAVAFTEGLGALILDIGEAVDAAVFSHLRFALQPTRTGQPLRLSLRDGANRTLGTPVALADYGGPPEAGVWKLYSIPLADLGATDRQVRGLALQDASGSAQPPLYLDELAFAGPPVDTPGLALGRTATAIPSSSPTRAPATTSATATAAATAATRVPTPSPTPPPPPTPTPTPSRTATATTAPATSTPTPAPTSTPTPAATPAATPTPAPTPAARPAASIARSFESVCRMRPDRRLCDATGRALWNGEVGAWQLLATQNRQPLPDEERVLAETIRLRLEMGDAPARIEYARRRGEAAVFLGGATFIPQAGSEALAHVQVELDNRGFATADLANAELVTEGGDVLLVLPPGATLAAGSRCRLSTGPAAENACAFSPVRAARLRGDRPVALILRNTAGERIDTLDLPPAP